MGLDIRVLENLVGHYTEVLDGCREVRDFLKVRGIRSTSDLVAGGEVREELLNMLVDGVDELVGG